jgi:hypothetical protein
MFLGASTAIVQPVGAEHRREKEKVQPIMKGNTAVGRANNQKLRVMPVPFVSWKTLYSEPNFRAVFRNLGR